MSGAGTMTDPYIIKNPENLNDIRNNATGSYYKFAKDVDLEYDTQNPNGRYYYSGSGWDPIKAVDDITIDFDGYGIYNLYINDNGFDRARGLFSTNTLQAIDGKMVNYVSTLGGDDGTFVGRGALKGDRLAVINSHLATQIEDVRLGLLIGRPSSNSSTLIRNSYGDETSSINSDGSCGGFVGRVIGSNSIHNETIYIDRGISRPEFTAVSGPTDPFVGWDQEYDIHQFSNNFWRSGMGTSNNYPQGDTGTEKTVGELQTLATYNDTATVGLDQVYDIVDKSVHDGRKETAIWYIEDGVDYPRLYSEYVPPMAGSGTAEDPYQVAYPEHLDAVRNDLSAYYVQVQHIDMKFATQNEAGRFYNNGNGFVPIGTPSTPFTGTYDGQGYIISNLYMDRGVDTALFGYVNHSTLRDLGLLNVNVRGNYNVGALIGSEEAGSTGTVDRCWSTGLVQADSSNELRLGGLVGLFRGTANDCFSLAKVKSYVPDEGAIGGFVGFAGGTYNRCWSAGPILPANITPTSFQGGFCGRDGGATFNDCFWDMDTSGFTTSSAGTGKTTAEMKDVATFTNTTTTGLTNPYDFVGNPNGDVANNDYWDIQGGYPFLTLSGPVPSTSVDQVIKTVTDSGSGLDSIDNNKPFTVTDSGSGADSVTVDTGTSSETKTVTDTVSAADATSLNLLTSVPDTATTTEVTTQAVDFSIADAATGVDNDTLLLDKLVTDTGSGADAATMSSDSGTVAGLPTGIDYAITYLPKPNADISDFVFVVDLAQMPPQWWAAADSTVGSKGRVSKNDATEASATQLASE